MTDDEINALLAKPLDAVLGIGRPAGGPQLTTMWFAWDGNAFYLSTTRDRHKYANVKRDPQVSLLVNDAAAHHYVTAYGQAETIEEPAEVARLTAPIFRKYSPNAPVPSATDLAERQRVVIVIRPDKIVSR